MENRKKEIVRIIKANAELPELSQQSQNIFEVLPALTFYISNQKTAQDLSGQIVQQETEVTIDIWANTSTEASEILRKLEATLRAEKWKLVFSADVPNPDKTIFHTTTRFEKVAGVI